MDSCGHAGAGALVSGLGRDSLHKVGIVRVASVRLVYGRGWLSVKARGTKGSHTILDGACSGLEWEVILGKVPRKI